MTPRIFLSAAIVGTNADLLASTRLASIPYSNSVLHMAFLANLANATNNYALTIQLPNGEVPVDSQLVFMGQEVENALGGNMDGRLAMKFDYPAPQGGHFTVSLTETGTAVCAYAIWLS